jgi:hypothetical protein
MHFAGKISGRWFDSHFMGSDVSGLVVFQPRIQISAGCLEPLALDKR